MTALRKICVVTGSRAEYGLLYWLMKHVDADADLQLQVIATGMHLSPEFGATYVHIQKDGFRIDARVEMLLSSDSATGTAKSIGLGVIGFADAFERLKPDIIVVLGDRFEIFAAAQAALIARIPIAHLHGGEITEGAFDESIRHSITKMAQWHFVAAESYRRRVVQLGESPDRVFNFGPTSFDVLSHLEWIDRPGLVTALGMSLKDPIFLVTYHPETLGRRQPVEALDELLSALEAFPDATVVFTYPNADAGGRGIMSRLERWVAANAKRAGLFVSLGQQRYLSAMREAQIVVGNSSSGLTEAPPLGKITVNIGDRQKGRLRPSSVIDSADDCESIVAAIQKALSWKSPATTAVKGEAGVSERIKNTLKAARLEIRKTFLDIEHTH